MSDLPSLIKRLEEATGPSRELDAEIGLVVGETPKVKKHYRRGQYPLYLIREEKIYRPYTGSIDAALTLVPEGAASQWTLCGWRDVAEVELWVGAGYHQTKGRTPALALCIAALRARDACAATQFVKGKI